MSDFSADAILAELKSFQRDAVEHVMYRLYDAPNASGRFLVADETGLGKSVIARGIIARTIERLQHDDSVDRIDIVYICSNSDLASQNLRRLNVTGDPHIGLTSRLTLLARESHRLAGTNTAGRKPVNLVSFTPGTSFEMGSFRTGSGEERALLHIILSELFGLSGPQQDSSKVLFQDSIRTPERFALLVDRMLHKLDGRVEQPILRAFERKIAESRLGDSYLSLLSDLAGEGTVPVFLKEQIRHLTAKLRAALAAASVDSLEPDLIILDEFQRFRHLLDEGEGGDAAKLAHDLFNYSDAKVLLLSATPYKPFTQANDESGDDHYHDLMTTLSFLAQGSSVAIADIREGFAEYRQQIVSGKPATEHLARLRENLLTIMSRTERPQLGGVIRERQLPSFPPTGADLAGFVALERLATELGTPIGLEYWKSVPYFASFMDNYKVASALDRRLLDNEGSIAGELKDLQQIDAHTISSYGQIEFGNSHLRALAAETLDKGWWKLLWLPPSLPYLAPGSIYGSIANEDVTKRVVFSSWTATPTAVASLLSYEAERRITEGSRLTVNSSEARQSISSRLDYSVSDDRPARMSTLAMFWPHPELALAGDPLRVLRDSGGDRITADEAELFVSTRLATGPETKFAWEAFFSRSGARPAGLPLEPSKLAQLLTARATEGADQNENSAGRLITAHVSHAIEIINRPENVASHPYLARLALHSPGNIAYRALGRLRDDNDLTSDAGQWRAAALLSNGIRSLFNRAESMLLLDKLNSAEDEYYWRAVLDYCADGNLQAALDEYFFQLRSEVAGAVLDDELLMALAERAVSAITMRPSVYHARNHSAQGESIPLTARFALRYGGKSQNEESARQPEIRNAFNSPFWPFVLASTSVGQEGIDFHWWSHAVVHWNVPSNPVDFEQREGRVNRFAGHAVRKNIAAAHASDVVSSEDPNPWKVAFEAAAVTHEELGDFSPFWVYPGDAKIERQLVSFPLSRDLTKIDRLREALTLYRLTLGQPRQEDMLEILKRRGVDAASMPVLNLSPPESSITAPIEAPPTMKPKDI
ncbi:helicase-like protein [Salinibacterium amurskyense]|uniref:Helicase-like protein n=1 Tax=Salinibacterium amurskyense TaxID=205941 RepID=A0A2M9D5H1_9MICO|nr:helicase C-terminal domain-containing protein [Salinibacterium amurskyense]PJJ80967.1 helicase-like protein [Salinibacterium amurskyense]RLQ83007.1 helicase [Salinibacterium amurskyense]GHD81929.1 helicase [Salinibacterium amurskyense]